MADPKQDLIKSILLRIRQGDRKARNELFTVLGDEQGFGAALLAMARKAMPRSHRARRLVDTRDILQSAFRTGMRHFSAFRGETEGELFGWLRAIIRTKAARAGRQKPEEPLDETQEAAPPSRAPQTLDSLLDLELSTALHRSIKALPLEQRLVIELRLRGLDSGEIASLLGLNSPTVRKRESRAVGQLRKAMGPD
jgi:RNA polymerase sigma factor (sigma-70 family)